MSTRSLGAGLYVPFPIENDPGIPNDPDSLGTAEIAIAAWYNGGSTSAITAAHPGISLSTAQSDGYDWGSSAMFYVSNLAYGTEVPATLFGQTSFSLVTPEPGAIALLAVGASAFLMRRRK